LIFGSFLEVFNPADELPVSRSSRYEAPTRASLRLKAGVLAEAERRHRAKPAPRTPSSSNPRAAITPTSDWAKAITPLLDDPSKTRLLPLHGAERDVPDLVVDLHGIVDVVFSSGGLDCGGPLAQRRRPSSQLATRERSATGLKRTKHEVLYTTASLGGAAPQPSQQRLTLHPPSSGCTFLGGPATTDTAGCNYFFYAARGR
jgi:hypothetical protein